jgi:regulator of protease activity HflC (stomatin/prohibitin superfamily)
MRHATSNRTLRPTEPNGGHLRISDLDREHAATTLRDHAGAGRLTLDELASRLEATFAARTRSQLDEQFADLPGSPGQRPSDDARAKLLGMRIHTAAYICASLAMIAIWATTGTGYFWPAWPMLGWGVGVLSHRKACGFALRRTA